MTRVYALDHSHDLPFEEVEALVGGKAAALGVMTRELGLPVPPGFVLTTATCREVLAGGWPEGLDQEIREHVVRLEEVVGRRFGDLADPLLVSVRSGAPVSMPGMMDTILNVGLAPGAVVSGDAAFTAVLRERLGAMYRTTVGADVPDDPWAQLRGAIEAVFGSWNTDRARAYRRKEGIPDDMGTGATVQAMVFGNHGERSATGVAFSRNPATGEPTLYGDVLFGAQGEDVVAGTHATEPIAVLYERLPAVGAELRSHADRLEHHFGELCDIEFTIEDGRLWMLQVRAGKRSPQAALRIAIDMAEDELFPLSREDAVRQVAQYLVDPPKIAVAADRPEVPPIVVGLPASPGRASGEIVTDAEAAVSAAEAGRTVILVRSETSPNDVHGMARAAGILTARGGLASHAAVVARGWGIPAVVGASEVVVDGDGIAIGERRLGRGELITIDGGTGEVFEGVVTGATEVAPEAATLLRWALELGIPIGEAQVADRSPIGEAPVTAESCLRALAIKGFATADGLADALRSNPQDVQPVVDELAAAGDAVASAGAFRLTDAGQARAAEVAAAERKAWGVEAASAALDAFLEIDHEVKSIITAWQMRDPDGQVINDHSDADYDAAVLDHLAAVHREAVGWLTENEAGYARLATYRARLASALVHAQDGDGRYVASPRVDSYHGVWFELHEDLIQLCGRTREEEAAAGRA